MINLTRIIQPPFLYYARHKFYLTVSISGMRFNRDQFNDYSPIMVPLVTSYVSRV